MHLLHFSLFSPRIFFDPCENCSSAPPMRSEPHPGCVWCRCIGFLRVAGLAAAAHTCHAMAMIKLKTAFRHCTIGLRGSAPTGSVRGPGWTPCALTILEQASAEKENRSGQSLQSRRTRTSRVPLGSTHLSDTVTCRCRMSKIKITVTRHCVELCACPWHY